MRQFILISTFILFTFFSFAQGDSWKYLGQTPPKDIPEVFGPNIVSTKKLEHSSPAFTTNLKCFFWSAITYPTNENINKIYYCQYENGKWTDARVAKFSGEYSDNIHVLYKNKLFFSSNRNQDELSDSLRTLHWTLKPNSKIWFIELGDDKWKEPELFSNPFGKVPKIINLSFSGNGNMYFLSFLKGVTQQCGIFYAKKKEIGFLEPQALPESINSTYQDWTPFIAPDESYMIFSSTRNPLRDDYGDLYISYKNNKGDWSRAIYMGDKINTKSQERFPSVSPDGKYLFFTRWTEENGQDIFWVSADIIDKLKIKATQE